MICLRNIFRLVLTSVANSIPNMTGHVTLWGFPLVQTCYLENAIRFVLFFVFNSS